jgi:hypothetical protein
VIVDRSLIARLDRSGAAYEAAVVAAYRASGDEIARSIPFGDGAIVAQGPGRYVNRAIGVSLTDPGDDGFDEIERCFVEAGVDPSLEVSSWAAPAVLLRLGERSYRPDWFGEMFVRPLDDIAPSSERVGTVGVRGVTADDVGEWQRIFAAAFGYDTPADLAVARLHTAAVFTVAGTSHLLAELDGRPVGCASLYVDPEARLAWFGGAATMPGCRGRGVQAALLAHRLAVGRSAGAELAVATAVPDRGSARNLRRAGFGPAHTRLVMRRRGTRPPRA